MQARRLDFDRTRGHWWWRPGWRHGRRYLTFHLTFEAAPELRSVAAGRAPALSAVEGVDVIPSEWLHLTMTGVRFADEADAARTEALVGAVFDRVPAAVGPLLLDELVLYQEGVAFSAAPDSWLMRLKRDQEDAAAEVYGAERPNDVFRPHVSLAYFSGAIDEDALVRALDPAALEPLRVTRPVLSLIELGRDEHVYTWRVLARRALG